MEKKIKIRNRTKKHSRRILGVHLHWLMGLLEILPRNRSQTRYLLERPWIRTHLRRSLRNSLNRRQWKWPSSRTALIVINKMDFFLGIQIPSWQIWSIRQKEKEKRIGSKLPRRRHQSESCCPRRTRRLLVRIVPQHYRKQKGIY